jgi:uncharacterized protein YhdP
MSGEVDLARETQKLTVRVIPGILEGVAIATGAGFGPLGIPLAFGISKIFREPLEQFISYDYLVTGSWSDPAPTRIQRPSLPEAERPQ